MRGEQRRARYDQSFSPTIRKRRTRESLSRYHRSAFEILEPRNPLAGNLTLASATLSDAFGNTLTAPMLGEQVFIRAAWTTQGLAANDSYRIDFKVDGVALTPGSMTQGAGGAGTGTWSQVWGGWFATPGTHSVEVRLDAGGSVAETDENDNLRTFQFTTAAAAPPFRLAQPIGGTPLVDWTVVNYVDVNPLAGAWADYQGGTVVYDGHDAHDLTLANFTRMDQGIPLFAAAAGTVEFTQDGNFDREVVGNSRPANFVQIDHGGGWKTLYFHMAAGSVSVKPGDVVAAGQLIGLVGSSGSSTDAHLHFAVFHNGGRVEPQYDPAAYWLRPRDYQLDQPVTVQDSGITNYSPFNDMKERPSEITTFPQTTTWPLWFWFRLSHLDVGDSYQVKWYRPNGSLFTTYNYTASGPERLGGYTWSLNSSAWASAPGNWRVAVEMGGVEKVSKNFVVGNTLVPEIRVTQGTTYIVDGRTTPIDFGSVAVGDAAPQLTWTIENHGSGPLTAGNLVLPPGFSLVGALPSTIAAGATANFTLQLDTARAGKKAGEIRFQTNDNDESVFQFQVSGTVTGAAPTGAPAITLPGPAAAFIKGAARVLLDASATFTDSDSPNLGGGSIRVEFDSGADSNDRLGIRHQGTAAGQISVTGLAVAYGGTVIGTYSGGTSGGALTIALNSAATPAAIQALLRSLDYGNANGLSLAPRNVRITVTDETGKVSNQPLKRLILAESLSLSTTSSSIIEGRGAITVTLQRNQADIGQSLVINLTSSDTSEATVPASVTIPAGATSASFSITSVDDNILDGDQVVTITASVAGYQSATTTLTVYDDAVTRPLWVGAGAILTSGKVVEYSQAGLPLATTTLSPGPGGDSAIRDLVLDSNQNVQIFTGTFTPYLTTLDPVKRTYSQVTTAGWSSANLTSIGGIAAYQGDVFVTDNQTVSAGAPRGLVRFRQSDGSTTRFATDTGLADVTLGADGQLYALDDAEPPKFVRVYDPVTLNLTRTISFPSSTIVHRGIVAAANGDIFTASWEGIVYRFDANWNLLNLLDTGVSELSDIDLAPDGTLLITSSLSEVLLTDTSLSRIQRRFNTGVINGHTFAAFGATPVTTAPMLTLEVSPAVANEASGSNTVQAKVTRLNQDLSQALVVTLTSNDTSEATTPASITIAAGEAAAYFNIVASDDSLVDGTQSVTITASAAGLASDSQNIQVTDNDLLSVSLASHVLSEAGGGTTTGTVVRGGADFSAPLTVTLASSDTSEATVPATVTILANQTSATFTVTAVDDTLLDGLQNVTISATATGLPLASDTLSVADFETLTVIVSPSSMTENGGSVTGTVTRGNTDISSAILVTLSSSDTTEATVPSQVTIPANATSTVFTVSAVDDAILDGSQSATITANFSGYVAVAGSVTVNDSETLVVSLLTNTISEIGGSTTGTVTRSNSDIGSPLTVNLTSSNASAATVVSSVTIPANTSFVTFTVTAVDDTVLDGVQSTTITASATGYTAGSQTVQVTDFETLSLTIQESSISEKGGIATGVVTRNNTDRSNALVVLLTSSDTSEATVPASVTIAAGEASASLTITAQDDALLDGLQTITLSAAATGYVSASDSLEVTDSESLTVSVVPNSIPENGSSALATVTRSNTDIAQPLVVTLSNSDSTEVSIPASVTIPAGAASTTFSVQPLVDALFDGPQSVTITATAVGYVSGSQVIQVQDIEVLTLTLAQTSVRENAGQTVATVRRNNSDNSNDLVVVIASSNSAAALAPASVTIPSGQAAADFIVTIVDDTLLDGQQSTTLTVSATGYVSGSQTLNVLDFEPLTVQLDQPIRPENAGITTGRVTRGTSSLGSPLVVTLTSSDTSEATTPATVTIPTGAATASFNINLIDDTLLDGDQMVTIRAIANGFESQDAVLTVADFETLTLSIITDILSELGETTTAVVIRGNSDISAPLTVTLTSSDSSEATVPASLTIGANQAFAAFSISSVDDQLLDGTQSVLISVAATGYTGSSRTLSVTDYETLSIEIVPSEVSEDGGVATGTITRSDSDSSGELQVSLTSSDTGELTVPATVTIPAGQISATFTATAVDDGIVDGRNTITITATSTGFISDDATVEVFDPPGNYHNPHNSLDTNDDGQLAPVDALIVVNILNSLGSGSANQIMANYTGDRVYPDSSGDQQIGPVDALLIINFLNFGESEGEFASATRDAFLATLPSPAPVSPPPLDWLEDVSHDVALARRRSQYDGLPVRRSDVRRTSSPSKYVPNS
ncbi:MAG: peptidoglycan DD-metalloendopeptidase family protein [Pirellulales bacterium]